MQNKFGLLTFSLKMLPKRVIHKKENLGHKIPQKKFSTRGNGWNFLYVVPGTVPDTFLPTPFYSQFFFNPYFGSLLPWLSLIKSIFNMFHVFAFTYYILLHCVTREYSMTSVLLRDDIAIPFLLERYMKHVFVAGLVYFILRANRPGSPSYYLLYVLIYVFIYICM